MRRILLQILFFLHFAPAIAFKAPTIHHQPSTINRISFYKAMEENNKALVDSQLALLQSGPPEKDQAFEGALMMKKAGMGGSAPAKLHLFKEGRRMLEEAIHRDPENGEYRFLRLMIQENAPGFLGYKKDIEKDAEFIRKSYKTLPVAVQHAIAGYNKKSTTLKLDLS